jgi:hypothetical protein
LLPNVACVARVASLSQSSSQKGGPEKGERANFFRGPLHRWEIRLRAERRAGELLADMPKHQGGRPEKTATDNQSSKWQKLASLPEDKFPCLGARNFSSAASREYGGRSREFRGRVVSYAARYMIDNHAL